MSNLKTLRERVKAQMEKCPKAIINLFGSSFAVRIVTGTYSLGRNTSVTLINMEDGQDFATISVNLPDNPPLPADVFYGKHWSENEGMLEQLVEQGVIEIVPEIPPANSGFCSNIRAYRLVKK